MKPSASDLAGATSPVAPPALQLHGLCKQWGQTKILQGVDMTVPEGQFHAVIGPNGAGKSTLFNVISGLTPASHGTVHLHGRDITRLPPHRINRLGLSRSFQVTNVFASLSVRENLQCAAMRHAGMGATLWASRARRRNLLDQTDALLLRLGLDERAAQLASTLTYAQRRALELGLVLATGASVVLLDEPTAGMNRQEAARMVDLIRDLCAGKALLIVEHDMAIVFDLAQCITVLVEGRVLASGPPSIVREDERVRQAYLGHPREGKA